MGEVAVQKKERESLWDELQKMEGRIMQRAHDLFMGGGSVSGRDLDNWLAAERELFWKPPIEVLEKEDHFDVRVAVAGVDPKDITVEVTTDDLIVKGESKSEKTDKKGEIHTSEFQVGSIFRSIHFPKRVEVNKVKAELKNGLLTITAPIAEEAKARKIDVQAA